MCGPYRGIRANMAQTSARIGLDHYGEKALGWSREAEHDRVRSTERLVDYGGPPRGGWCWRWLRSRSSAMQILADPEKAAADAQRVNGSKGSRRSWRGLVAVRDGGSSLPARMGPGGAVLQQQMVHDRNRGVRLSHACRAGLYDRFGPAGYLHFGEDARNMVADRVWRQSEPGGYRGVGQAGCDQVEYLPLSRG